jgi:hypothetical protein
LQVQCDGGNVNFRLDELLQLWHMAFLDSTAEREDRRFRFFGSSNPQHLVGVGGKPMAINKLLKTEGLESVSHSRKSKIYEVR